MKKIILGAVALTLCVGLTACGTSNNNATVTSLSNQLDETANAVSSMQTINPTDISLTKSMLETIASKDSSDAIYDNVINTQSALLNEEYYKTEILNRTAKLKDGLSKDLKLSKSQISAIKELSSSLSKYTNSVAYTKNEMNNAIKSIVSMKKNVDKNTDKINAKLNRLACNSNSRSSYYENILNTLTELEKSLGQETKEQTTENTENKTKNIDTYINPANEISQADENTSGNENDTNNSNNNGNNANHNCPYCNPNNAYGYGINNAYGANPINGNNVYNRFGRFNPNRNTDTYGPGIRNIDTYGFNGYGSNNGMYGAYGNGAFGNGAFGANGYGNGAYGMNGYGVNGANGVYGMNSNNFNRLTTPIAAPATPVAPVALTENNNDCKDCEKSPLEVCEMEKVSLATDKIIPEKRLEDFETIENGELKKEQKETKIVSISDEEQKFSTKINDDLNKKVDNASKIDNTTNKNLNKIDNIENSQTNNKIQNKPAVKNENSTENKDNTLIDKEKSVNEQNFDNKTERKTAKTLNKNVFKGPKIKIVDARRKNIENEKIDDEMNTPIKAYERNHIA